MPQLKFTAEDARILADNVRKDRDDNVIAELISRIQVEAGAGKYYLIVCDLDISNNVSSILKENGYDIQSEVHRGEVATTIRWLPKSEVNTPLKLFPKEAEAVVVKEVKDESI